MYVAMGDHISKHSNAAGARGQCHDLGPCIFGWQALITLAAGENEFLSSNYLQEGLSEYWRYLLFSTASDRATTGRVGWDDRPAFYPGRTFMPGAEDGLVFG